MYVSAGDSTMNTYLRPFLKIAVVAAFGAIMAIWCFSLTSATASEMGEP